MGVQCAALLSTTVPPVSLVLLSTRVVPPMGCLSPASYRLLVVGTWLLRGPRAQGPLETLPRPTQQWWSFLKARPSTRLLRHPSTACPLPQALPQRKRHAQPSRSNARRTSRP